MAVSGCRQPVGCNFRGPTGFPLEHMTDLPRTAVWGLTVACLAIGVSAGPARAELLHGAIDDPRDYAPLGGRDLKRLTSTFDSDRGVWSLKARFYGPLTVRGAARLRAALRLRASSGACRAQTVAIFIALTDPRRSGAPTQGLYSGPESPSGDTIITMTVSGDRREVLLTFSDRRLAGKQACSVVGITLSKYFRFDEAMEIRFDTPDSDGDGFPDVRDRCPREPDRGSGCPGIPDRVSPRLWVDVSNSGLRVGGDGRVSPIHLWYASEPVTAKLKIFLRAEVIGRRIVRVARGQRLAVSLRLNRRGRAVLRARRRLDTVIAARVRDRVGNANTQLQDLVLRTRR
jgi:hypothetical protein